MDVQVQGEGVLGLQRKRPIDQLLSNDRSLLKAFVFLHSSQKASYRKLTE